MDLLDLRKEIDKIDDELIPLLQKRMNISTQVAEYKVEHGLPVLNEKREQEILDGVAEKCGEQGNAIKTVFSATMDASRALQHKVIGGGKELRELVKNAENEEVVTKGKSVACAGVRGAYAYEAAKKMIPDGKIVFCGGFKEVFSKVNSGETEFGVIPVENSVAGSVHESYDLIMKYRLYIVRAYALPINHCLCAIKGAKLENIKKVYSHQQALNQCADYLNKSNLVGINYYNTAAAGEYVSKQDDLSIAAICSEYAAKEFGLEVLDRNIQASDTNSTRFIVISKNLQIDESADKISLIFSLPHTTGSLYRILGRFSMAGLNLTKIESRPIIEDNFTYSFYTDLFGNVRDNKTLDLLCALSSELPGFTFLGNFKED